MTGLSADAVVGKLVRVWGWFDGMSVDGFVDACVDADVDDLARHDGFASAMARVGWLIVDGQNERIGIPDFDSHHGNSARKRLLKTARQRRYRKGVADRSVDAPVVASVDAKASTGVDASATSTVHNRREQHLQQKKNQEHVLQAARFDEFWSVYPIKRGKKTARAKWVSKRLDERADELITDVQKRIASDEQWLRGFAPHASTYLQQERWEDELQGRREPAPQPSKSAKALNAIERLKHGHAELNFEPNATPDVPRIGGPARR